MRVIVNGFDMICEEDYTAPPSPSIKSLDDEPIDDEPIDDEPIEDEPIEDEPIEDDPFEDDPFGDEPVEDEPVEDEPVEDEPVEDEPVEDEPIDDEPTDVPLHDVASHAIRALHEYQVLLSLTYTLPILRSSPVAFFDTLIVIDPEGDKTIVIEHNCRRIRYRVSSRTLALASPLFRVENGLYTDDPTNNPTEEASLSLQKAPNFKPWAMEPMLRALHHQPVSGLDWGSAHQLVEFALHCEVYSCARVLGSWACNWAYQCRQSAPIDVAYLFTAGVVMNNNVIQHLAAKNAKIVNIEELRHWWEQDPIVSQLSPSQAQELAEYVCIKIRLVFQMLYATVDTVRETGSDHEYFDCQECGIKTDHSNRYCDMVCFRRICTLEKRLHCISRVLDNSGMVPTEGDVNIVSAQRMADMLINAWDVTEYECPLKTTCTLHMAMNRFVQRLRYEI